MGASSSRCFCIGNAEEFPCRENDGAAGLHIEGASTSAETDAPSAKTEPSNNPVCGGLSEMGASSSSCFSSAKAAESPSIVVDAVAEVEAVLAEGASTSGRTEYYSVRCEAMKRSRGQFSDDVAMEIEFSKSHWSEVSRLEVAPQSAEEKRLNRENRKLFKQLVKKYPLLFQQNLLGHGFVLGRMIAEGGQAKIYEVVDSPLILMKVFERGTSLRDLQGLWPLPVLKGDVHQCIFFAGMLEDGRFTFVMVRCWGDLRKLIDQAMLEKNVDGIECPPFPYNGCEEATGKNLHTFDFMFEIAQHMESLHAKGVSHRDLKASNVLLRGCFGEDFNFYELNMKGIMVADFECSIGVLGTGFWRAPEVLVDPRNASSLTNEQWKKADVYSYGMICFEIVTGKIPFDGELEGTTAERQLVIEGKRPQLPSDLDDAMKDLITQCWKTNPNLRPTFFEILNMVEAISSKHCEFRLFGIIDELPPQYHLATVQEVKDYPIALKKAMPEWKIANLANGSIDVNLYGMKTRLEKRSDASHKLARFHHQARSLGLMNLDTVEIISLRESKNISCKSIFNATLTKRHGNGICNFYSHPLFFTMAFPVLISSMLQRCLEPYNTTMLGVA